MGSKFKKCLFYICHFYVRYIMAIKAADSKHHVFASDLEVSNVARILNLFVFFNDSSIVRKTVENLTYILD